MSKASLETAIRNDILTLITDTLSSHYDTDVMPVSASELTIPVLDAEGNEKFALIKVSIPRGSRASGGYVPYDGYAAAEDYKGELDEKAAKRKASEEKKESKKKVRAQRKAARETIKSLKEKDLQAMIEEENKKPNVDES